MIPAIAKGSTVLKSSLLVIFLGVLTVQAQAAQGRKFTCLLSLPHNVELKMEAPLVDGKAAIEHAFSEGTKSFKIEAQVWGFVPDRKGRIAGFTAMKQMRDSVSTPPNYAISHCELKKPSEACFMSLSATLEGIGALARCSVPAE